MTHLELSAAVHGLALQVGAIDSYTSECRNTRRDGKARVYYYAQIWFERPKSLDDKGDVVGVTGENHTEILDKLNAGLMDRAAARNTEPAPC